MRDYSAIIRKRYFSLADRFILEFRGSWKKKQTKKTLSLHRNSIAKRLNPFFSFRCSWRSLKTEKADKKTSHRIMDLKSTFRPGTGYRNASKMCVEIAGKSWKIYPNPSHVSKQLFLLRTDATISDALWLLRKRTMPSVGGGCGDTRGLALAWWRLIPYQSVSRIITVGPVSGRQSCI